MMKNNPIIIAGPCSVESKEQILESATELKRRDVKMMRASLWKPRTSPDFEGVGIRGMSWFAEITKLNIAVGTEILLPGQVGKLVKCIEKYKGNSSNLFFWIGSRNQNHLLQRKIAKEIINNTEKNVKLIIKNQPWKDEKHWIGIIKHIIKSNINPERLIICHRGFFPNDHINLSNFRNIPDFKMAMRIKKIFNIPTIFDPSHIGGDIKNIFKITKFASFFDFDGAMIEVHPAPHKAYTDRYQQLSFQDFDKLLKFLK
jgi:3-deoxy-D-arabino-heptulosonate 7-phosphate (DAHP) synthase